LIFKWLINIFNYKKVGFKIINGFLFKSFKRLILNIDIILTDDYIIDILRNVDIVYKKFDLNIFIFKILCDKKKIFKIGNKKKIFNLFLNTKKKKAKYNKIFYKYFFEYFNKYQFVS
jgi:hypothetical protein